MQKVIKVTESNAIRKKMMAATSMLLVAVIMLVSASYAWFTLSTAPEITGINTTVGANGNLEMALANYSTWTGSSEPSSAVGTSMTVADVDIANESWGNLVDLSDNSIYGLKEISLMPARLNFADTAGTKISDEFILKTPTYGYDGRVEALVANAITGGYKNSGFVDNDEAYGVRAIGVASAMTERQLIYRSAVSAIANNISTANLEARKTININGTGIADIIVKHATTPDETTETYTSTEVAPLVAAAEDMQTVVGYLKDGWEAAVVGMLASATGETNKALTEEVVKTLQPLIENESYSVSGTSISITGVDGSFDIGSLGAVYTEDIAPLATNVSNAITALGKLTGDTIAWADIKNAMAPLIDPELVQVNGFKATELTATDNLNQLIADVLGGKGITVELPAGSGAFADIAELCGDYYGEVQLRNLTYGGLTVPDTVASMKTIVNVNEDTCKLGVAKGEVEKAGSPSSESEEAAAITDFYGYAIDLLFRTNAANSDLLLEVDGAQRVYNDSENELTQGEGCSMTFSAVQGFATADMVKLMGAIRVVFMAKDGTILSFAKLDTAATETTADGTKANLKLCDATVDANGIVTIGEFKTEQTLFENLPQNQAVGVTAVVYLDGDIVDNSMVANGAQTMTGSMNLQFKSSATLNPMDNTALFEGAE